MKKQKNKVDLSVIVPCYNEKDNIPLIVKRFGEVLPGEINAELVLVNNGSTDGSDEVIKECMKKYKFICNVRVENNIGYGFGIWSGLKNAKGEYLCWTHADMQTDLNDAFNAFELIKQKPEPEKCFVKGKRYGRQLFDRFFTNCMSLFETVMLKKVLYDINAQPNLFHKNFLNDINNPPNDFSFDLYFYYIAKKKGYEILRFPVEFKQRIHGQSHWNTGLMAKWKFIKRTAKFTFELKKLLKNQSTTIRDDKSNTFRS